ncbi:MAG TPA: helix-turn-helix domain-containing protein [Pseudonocardiaceae bacterium]|nr:helix-turn-helix domain-containing protein [Pseudonocardiaceae bacterium]
MLRAATTARLSRELADDLLDGDAAAGADALARRAHELGHDPHRPYRALAVRWGGRALDDRRIETVAAAARALQVACWSTRRDHALIVLAQRSDADSWADTGVWQALHHAIAQDFPDGVGSIGVGGLAATLTDIPRSYRQAQQALRIRSAAPNPHGVTNHDQLGVYGLVADPEAADFVQEWLAPLLDYDQQHGAELTDTLAAYLKHNGKYGDTAADLTIHRSTVRYRLHVINSLTNHDLDDSEIRFNLQIATHIWRGQRHTP